MGAKRKKVKAKHKGIYHDILSAFIVFCVTGLFVISQLERTDPLTAQGAFIGSVVIAIMYVVYLFTR